MVQFDNRFRQIKVKVVYYGPALGGKTTSLQYIHWVMDPDRRTQLYSINTANDRTVFFDLMSLTLGSIRGHQLMMQLCTVPGQVQYNATRRAVLSGVDAVVFIADSQADELDANIESRRNLDDNLRANGVDPETIPVVYQLNKQDLEPLTPNRELDHAINREGAPVFPTTATTGEGVVEAFAEITGLALAAVADKLGVGGNQRALERLQEQARHSLEPYFNAKPRPSGFVDEPSVVRTETTDAAWPLPEDELVQQAVEANLEMTELNANVDTVRKQLELKVTALESIGQFASVLGSVRNPGAILEHLLETAGELLHTAAGAVLLFADRGLRSVKLAGVERDPLLTAPSTLGTPLAGELADAKGPTLIAREATDVEPSELEYAVEESGYTSAMALPLLARDELLGLLTLYADDRRLPLDSSDLQLASTLASSASLAYANAVAWRRLADVNQDLESQVEARTAELRETLDEVQRLNADLRGQHQLLQRAYTDLEEVERLKHELLSRVSHELRTPVTSIRSAATILERYSEMEPDEAARFVGIVLQGTTKLSEVIDGVVQAATLAAGSEPPAASPVDLKTLFRAAATPLMPVADKKGVSVSIRARGGVTAVHCDLDTFGPALRAVIKNAIEYTREGGSVDIDVAGATVDGARWTTITVSDSGVGIPEENLPKVTQVFWQGGDLMTEKPSGVGLGLAIATRVAEAHGGRLEITSEVGEGTRVRFTIPEDGA